MKTKMIMNEFATFVATMMNRNQDNIDCHCNPQSYDIYITILFLFYFIAAYYILYINSEKKKEKKENNQ